jgi:hypothetical protein
VKRPLTYLTYLLRISDLGWSQSIKENIERVNRKIQFRFIPDSITNMVVRLTEKWLMLRLKNNLHRVPLPFFNLKI